jgi:hypothetical protein
MTKVMMNIDEISRMYYECINHAGDHDACTIASTLSNVICEVCFNEGHEPTIYNSGHVRVDIPFSQNAYAVFRAVEGVMRQAARQQPEHIKIY